MDKEAKKVKRSISSTKRMDAFGKTITEGVSNKYMEHLKREAKENRFIEKHL